VPQAPIASAIASNMVRFASRMEHAGYSPSHMAAKLADGRPPIQVRSLAG
jgi:hypothetical protein